MRFKEGEFTQEDRAKIDLLVMKGIPKKAIKSILDLFEKGDTYRARKRIKIAEEYFKRQNKEKYAAEKLARLTCLITELKTIAKIDENGKYKERREDLKKNITLELQEAKKMRMYSVLGMQHIGEFSKACGLSSEEMDNLLFQAG